MDVENLHFFVVVAREKSISKAAQLLHITQPTLSTRIRRLEEELGFDLLERTWEGVRLTKQGQYFLSSVIQYIQDLSNAKSILVKVNREWDHSGKTLEEVLSKDRLIIGTDMILVPLVVNHFTSELSANFPNLDCKYLSRPSLSLLDLYENGGIDVAVFFHDHHHPVTYSTPLIDDKIVLLCSSKDFEHIKEDLSNIDLLLNEPFVLFERHALEIYRSTTNVLMDVFGQIPERFHIVNDMTTMFDLLAGGKCFTLMPKLSVIPLLQQSPHIRMIPIDSMTSFRLPIHIAFSDSNRFAGPLHHIQRSLSLYMNEVRASY